MRNTKVKSPSSLSRGFHAGKAAADGLEAALLAQSGVRGAAGFLVGPAGLAAVTAPAPDFAAGLKGPGTDWEIVAKPYACGIVSHPVIDAGVALRGRVDPAQVAEVVVTVNPVVPDAMAVEDPADGLESKFSVYHCFAVGLLFGADGLDQFSAGMARAPGVVGLRRLVRVVLDPAIRRDECRVTVGLTDGSTVAHHVEHATGSIACPVTDEQLRAKGLALVTPVLGPARAATFVDLAFSLEELDSVATLIDASVSSGGRPTD